MGILADAPCEFSRGACFKGLRRQARCLSTKKQPVSGLVRYTLLISTKQGGVDAESCLITSWYSKAQRSDGSASSPSTSGKGTVSWSPCGARPGLERPKL